MSLKSGVYCVPTSPSHAFGAGPSLSALGGEEGWGEVGDSSALGER